jgi:hypothetical protein
MNRAVLRRRSDTIYIAVRRSRCPLSAQRHHLMQCKCPPKTQSGHAVCGVVANQHGCLHLSVLLRASNEPVRRRRRCASDGSLDCVIACSYAAGVVNFGLPFNQLFRRLFSVPIKGIIASRCCFRCPAGSFPPPLRSRRYAGQRRVIRARRRGHSAGSNECPLLVSRRHPWLAGDRTLTSFRVLMTVRLPT